MKTPIPLALAALLALAGACSSDAGGMDEETITMRLAGLETSGEFTRINATPFESQHAAETVNVWVSNEGVDLYRDLDPDDSSAAIEDFPEFTMIVKEMLDEEGALTAYTVMVKGAEGGVARTDDWWWGMYDAGGALQMSGELGFCIDCHEANGLQRTDWVQGVPMDAR